jgi:hypothetical protein
VNTEPIEMELKNQKFLMNVTEGCSALWKDKIIEGYGTNG